MKHSKKGSQVALFTDKDVRRDYLKSKQWVESHMRIKLHMSGMAVAYEDTGGARRKKNPDLQPLPGREQGSLFSQQKHSIADAVEWIRKNSAYKPRIFVVTNPGFVDAPPEGKLIQALVHNLKNGYGMKNYVWVRELTQAGYPHWHFVADVKRFDAVHLSKWWSKQFGAEAKNSIRLGTKPGKNGQRKFWIQGPKMCWYLTKYIGKDIGTGVKGERKKYRTFAISQEARLKSEPLLFESVTMLNYDNSHTRIFSLAHKSTDQEKAIVINPRAFNWKWTGRGQTYVGFKHRSQKSPKALVKSSALV